VLWAKKFKRQRRFCQLGLSVASPPKNTTTVEGCGLEGQLMVETNKCTDLRIRQLSEERYNVVHEVLVVDD